MALLRFPKENQKHVLLLDKANDLLREGVTSESVSASFQLCEQCADEKSPRGTFCKAMMLYIAQVQTGEDATDKIFPLLNAAIKAKYPFAYDLKADLLADADQENELFRLLRSWKGDSPTKYYYWGGFFAGIHEAKGAKRNLAKAADCFSKAAKLYLAYDGLKETFAAQFDDYFLRTGNSNYFVEQAGYSLRMLMYVYTVWNARENRASYLSAYADAQKYADAQIKYKTAVFYAEACMDNVMGMYSFKTVTSLMERIKIRYHELSEDLQASLRDDYDEIWQKYDDFCTAEQERLAAIGEIPVYTANHMANQNVLGSLAHDLGEGLSRWASSASSGETEYTVSMGNSTYKVNELGEMVDEYGQSNGLRVDTTSRRVYDSNMNAVGFFDSFGEYHSY